jgi:hypothetical protein
MENRSSSEENSRTARAALVSCFQLATTTPVTASAGATGGAAALARDGIAPQAAAAGSDTLLETAMKIALVVASVAGRVDPYSIVECVDDAEDEEEGGRRKEEGGRRRFGSCCCCC